MKSSSLPNSLSLIFVSSLSQKSLDSIILYVSGNKYDLLYINQFDLFQYFLDSLMFCGVRQEALNKFSELSKIFKIKNINSKFYKKKLKIH